ncbi:DUF3027 domain-containing protein [Microbacterium sp. 22195]|uniref:DUF3027 domain-containing protein n=1 Tax=Microbacterium sp. 22195 TaxID=3453891 RepID=UPI003F87A2BF
MTSTPDELASAARELALAALHEITPASTVGPAAGHSVEESGAVSLRFENRLPGYPGWYWTVSVAQVDGEEPTVLEVELMPGESALLAPDWVPWAERLAEYRAHQAELAEQAAAAGDDADEDSDDSDESDDEESDESDEDEDDDHEESDLLHAGDLDGVDIDELDADAEASDEDDDDPEDDSEDEDEDGDDSDEEE